MTAQEIIKKGLYDVSVQLMDDEIREEIHREISQCTDLEFLEAYMVKHREKYGIDFTV